MGCVEAALAKEAAAAGAQNMADGYPREDGFDHSKAERAPGECEQGYMSRAGDGGLTGSKEAESPPPPNKITNSSLSVNDNGEAEGLKMELAPGDPNNPSPFQTQWTWDPPVPGLTLDPATGQITGKVDEMKQYSTTVYARDEEFNIIDQKTYNLNATPPPTTPSGGNAGVQLQSPLADYNRISGTYGEQRTGYKHKGVDFAAANGTQIYAPADGEVVLQRSQNGYGNTVAIAHPSAANPQVVTLYGHLSASDVSYGQKVTSGQPIAKVGNTGRSSGPHLHYETRDPSFITGSNSGNFSAPTHNPLDSMNGPLKLDKGAAQQAIAQNPNNPTMDPGGPGSGNIQTTNQTNRTFKSSNCDKPFSPTSVPESADPTKGTTGNVSSAAGCSTAAGTSKEDVISRINATLDKHPELDAEDRKYILTTAKIESQFDPCAKNPNSSATGLYQFLDKTGAGYGVPSTADRTDVEKSTEAMIQMYNKDVERIWNGYVASGKTKIAGLPIAQNSYTANYANLTKSEFAYGLIHHDGVGNAVKGINKGGVQYYQSQMKKSS